MIELQNLSKTFQTNGKDVKAVDSVSLIVNKGEICVFLGPSGCGKSTTLKMINRLIKPTSGKILINGEDTTDLDAVTLRRNIGYVIQQIGLFPNMTIEENITIVPRLLGWDKQKCHDRARELMSMIKLEPKQYLSRYPGELSGGQQQRIGVIRALAADAAPAKKDVLVRRRTARGRAKVDRAYLRRAFPRVPAQATCTT